MSRQWAEELRWLEYGQRLSLQRRNVGASPSTRQPATAARLFNAALHGGGQAAGQCRWGIQAGARADLLVLDVRVPGLLGVPATHTLDALVFATNTSAVRDVVVAGHYVVCDRQHIHAAHTASEFEHVMQALWQAPSGNF
jgi:formimidoylglutamate deiminase